MWRVVRSGGGGKWSAGSGLPAAPFVPSFFEAVHKGALAFRLAAMAASLCFAGRNAAHRGKVNSGTHDDEPEDPYEYVLEGDPHQEEQHPGQRGQYANYDVPGGPAAAGIPPCRVAPGPRPGDQR